MMFSEKLKLLRTSAGMSQTALAKALCVTTRTVQHYEAGDRYPQNIQITHRICELFQVSPSYLMSEQDEFIGDSIKRFGTNGKSKANAIIAETSSLFKNDELDEVDKELFFKSITEIYFKSKKHMKILQKG